MSDDNSPMSELKPAREPNAAPDFRMRDAEKTKAEILLAARDEFARHGLAGARVERIAERADVNKRLLYYYFSNKDDLFLAVLEQAYADIRRTPCSKA